MNYNELNLPYQGERSLFSFPKHYPIASPFIPFEGRLKNSQEAAHPITSKQLWKRTQSLEKRDDLKGVTGS